MRHGTATLLAALDIATDAVFTECKPATGIRSFLSFLRRLDAATPEQLLDAVNERVARMNRWSKSGVWSARSWRWFNALWRQQVTAWMGGR